MKRKVKSIRKTMWGVYWGPHDRRKQLVARFKGYLGDLPSETRRCIVPGIFAIFTVLTLYAFDKAIYDIDRNDGSRIETGHVGRVKLPTPAEIDNHLTPYLYGTDEE